MIAGTLEVQLLANLARLQQDMTQAKGMVGSATRDIERMASQARAALGAIGVGIGIGGIVAVFKSITDAGDAAVKASQKAGVGIEAWQQYAYAAKLAGVSSEQLGKGLKGLGDFANQVTIGSSEAVDMFKRLGVSVRDAGGNMKPTEVLLLDMAERFASMPDGLEKTTAATKVFGKAGMDLIPFLNQGRDGIEALLVEAERLGVVMDGSTALAAEALNDNMERLSTSLRGMAVRAVAPLLPFLNQMAEGMAKGRIEGEGFRGTSESITTGLRLLTSAALTTVAVFESIGNAIGAVAAAAQAFGSGEWSRIGGIFAAARSDNEAVSNGLGARLGALWNGVNTEAPKAAVAMRALGQSVISVERNTKDAEAAAKALLAAEEMAAKDAAEAWEWYEKYRTKIEKEEAAHRITVAEAEETAREMAIDDLIGAWKAYDDYVRKQDRQRLDDAQQQYGGFLTGIEGAFRDAWNSIGDSWKDALGTMKNALKRILLDFIYQSFARPIVLNFVASAANSLGLSGLGSLATTAAGGGGGLMGSLGGLLGISGGTLGLIAGGIGLAAALFSAFDDGPENPNFRWTQGTGGAGLFGGIGSEGNFNFNSSGISGIVGGYDQRLARILGAGGTAAATSQLAAYTQAGLRTDGQPAQFAIPEGADAAGAEQIALEILQSRYGIIFQQIDAGIAETIRAWSGTSTELQTYIDTAIGIIEGLQEMNLPGLDLAGLQQMQRDGETLAQTFQRVAGQWSWFQENFTSEAVLLERAQRQLVDGFAALGMDIPAGVDAFRELVESLDVTDPRWQGLMDLAPAFLTVTNAAGNATDATEDLTRALQEQADLQRRIEDSVRDSRMRQLDAVVNARGGLQDFLGRTMLDPAVTILTPQERLAESRRQYEEILALARGGDLGAAGQLGGAAESYLRIARELFASSSSYVDIFNRVTGDVGAVDARLAIDEQMLRATLGLGATMEEVRDLLIEIRDKGALVTSASPERR